jgi:hypothetical protein
MCNVEEDDIVYANYQDTVMVTPFTIVLDHAWKSVVVTIRGSQYIDDWISDTVMVPIEL